MPTALKYRLQELTDALPRGVTIKTIDELLRKHYDISSQTFLRHRAITMDDPREISGGRLRAYAEFFGVTMDDLLNLQDGPKKRESIYRLLNLHQRPKISDVAALAGMSAPR